MPSVLVTGTFDDLRSRHVRFLHAASRTGPVHAAFWSDALVRQFIGRDPTFPAAERRYYLEALRWVDRVSEVTSLETPDALPRDLAADGATWVLAPDDEHVEAKRRVADAIGVAVRVLRADELAGFPDEHAGQILPPPAGKKKVIATGCFDWFHSGHVRFCEEIAELGAVYVCVGHDANIALLKGVGHPLFPQDERRFVVGSVRYVHQALVTSGTGWMDAEPEIARIRPDLYAVNEDGDKPEKRAFCQRHGIEYVVLKRLPAPGLERRASTSLRGF